jgi:CheY-like chemotaxis protein
MGMEITSSRLTFDIVIAQHARQRIRGSPDLRAGRSWLFTDERIAAAAYHPAMHDSSSPDAETAPRILVVDDDHAIVQLAVRGLRLRGHEALTAYTGPEAVRVASKMEHLDLLITDVNVPGKGGRDLAAHIAIYHPAAQVLYISGFNEETIAAQGIVTQAGSFLAKPFTVTAFAEAVEHLLGC